MSQRPSYLRTESGVYLVAYLVKGKNRSTSNLQFVAKYAVNVDRKRRFAPFD